MNCETQAEIDQFSAALIEGSGAQGPCGWLKDRFGVSWRTVPAAQPRLPGDAGS